MEAGKCEDPRNLDKGQIIMVGASPKQDRLWGASSQQRRVLDTGITIHKPVTVCWAPKIHHNKGYPFWYKYITEGLLWRKPEKFYDGYCLSPCCVWDCIVTTAYKWQINIRTGPWIYCQKDLLLTSWY